MTLNFLKKLFSKSKQSDISEQPINAQSFKIIITEFLDNVDENSGEIIARLLQKKEGISVHYFNQPFDKNFLNFDSKELFDWMDKGQDIADKAEAYVVVWGYRDGDRIRINFQSPNQYESNRKIFISLTDSLYIPAEYINNPDNFPESVLDLIYCGILSAINIRSEFNPYRKYLLRKTVNRLLNDDNINSLISEYTPYIMNFLGIAYLSYAYDNKDSGDFKKIKNIFENAIKHQNKITNQTQLGCFYYHLGQLYDTAAAHIEKNSISYCRGAVEYYIQAQRYLGKYNYPYEYGSICYRLSKLYHSYWIQKSDSQALRDAVFQLREAEKIYTFALFPEFWANIQANLGHLLSILGGVGNSKEIFELAITSFKNKQKVTTEKSYPTSWAKTQNDIGDIYYRLGKANNDVVLLEESLEYFHDALYIFENERNWHEVKNTSISIAKTNQTLALIKYRE
ncbi:MAG: hypothetical protein LBR70_01560 [Lactobacillaceae bacterium]|jgi:hypothetical protein|nr:hypothetical protein [Lactobacillaceae bacterium]